MKRKLKIGAIVIATLFVAFVTVHLFYLNSMAAIETYPADSFLEKASGKTAMIVTAHDDDAYSFSGTIFKLVSEGWTVRQISFKRKEEEKNEMFYKVGRLQKLQGIDLIATKYRNDLDTNTRPYMPVTDFDAVFNHDTIYSDLSALLDKYKPEVIFSLDDSIGGYGNSEHVFISRLVVEYCNRNKDVKDFSVKRIYQAVFPPSMAEAIMVKNSWTEFNPYTEGKKAYKCKGMPLPDVCVDIADQGASKKEYMNGFSEKDKKNIRKFSPYYNWYPSWLYFRIFGKEYFRVIKTA